MSAFGDVVVDEATCHASYLKEHYPGSVFHELAAIEPHVELANFRDAQIA